MKSKVLLVSLLCLCSFTWATVKPFSFECRTKVIRGGHVFYENHQYTYNFRIDVITERGGRKSEKMIQGRHPFIIAKPGERYSVRIHNPLPVKVAVNLSIDGLCSLSGDPCSPSSGSKWLINPHSYVTISGWQVSSQSNRRFYFTSRESSYAAWQSNQWGSDLTVNCGMIAAAYFWNRRDLERHFERYPIVEEDDDDEVATMRAPRSTEQSMAKSHDAGTGMGEKQHHPVRTVNFNYNMGMYHNHNAVKIYYDFYSYPYGYQKKSPQPRYIPEDSRYAPEQPDDDNDDDDDRYHPDYEDEE